MDRTWRALIVDQVQKDQLRWNEEGKIDVEHLPMEYIHVEKDVHAINAIPIDIVDVTASRNVKIMAVLSWRWDVEVGAVSRNLHSAVIYARYAGIKHLFIDLVSIDQGLDPQSLIDEVNAFSQLYSTLRAIKSYDTPGESMSIGTRRPWIYHEQRLIKQSAQLAVSVRHSTKFNKWKDGLDQMARTFDRTFFQTAVLVLNKSIKWDKHEDFRFLMPPIAGPLMQLLRMMTNEDYLLSVAILSALNDPHKMWAPSDAKIHRIEYVRYAFRPWTSKCGYDVLLDEVKIATWWTLIPYQLKKFQFVEGARDIVLTRLGVAVEDIVKVKMSQKMRIPLNVSSTVRNLLGTLDKHVEDSYYWVDLEREMVSKETVSMMWDDFSMSRT